MHLLLIYVQRDTKRETVKLDLYAVANVLASDVILCTTLLCVRNSPPQTNSGWKFRQSVRNKSARSRPRKIFYGTAQAELYELLYYIFIKIISKVEANFEIINLGDYFFFFFLKK